MGLAARHLELTSWLRRHPQLAAVRRVERAGNPLERVGILGGVNHSVAPLQVQGLEVAAPRPQLAEGVVRARGRWTIVDPPELEVAARARDDVAVYAGRR